MMEGLRTEAPACNTIELMDLYPSARTQARRPRLRFAVKSRGSQWEARKAVRRRWGWLLR